MKVSLRNAKVFTNLYVKPTGCHQYLHYLLAHLYNIIKSVVFSKTLCIGRLSSSEKDSENHKEKTNSCFRKRGFNFSNFKIKNNGNDNNLKRIPLVVTYHPLL